MMCAAQAIPTLLFWEVRRKDFVESLAHHVATLILIVYSYYIKYGHLMLRCFCDGLAAPVCWCLRLHLHLSTRCATCQSLSSHK